MKNISILIGGKAGFGIDASSLAIGCLLDKLGYRLYIYRDYPSLIRGGHTFSIIRASEEQAYAHRNEIDFLLALNQDTINLHKDKLRTSSIVIYDSDAVKIDGLMPGVQSIGVPITKIVKEENAPEIMRNSCIIGGFRKINGIDWPITEGVLRKIIQKETDLNLKLALRVYNEAEPLTKIVALGKDSLPLLTGNEIIGLGLVLQG